MLIKIKTDIIVDVGDNEQAEEACSAISTSLASVMCDFPHGEVVDVDVDQYEKVTAAEATEQGWVEE
jgi:hypothetical protein